jgi:citrate synthase
MDETEKLSKQITFYAVYTLLRKGETPDQTERLRIDDARKFLEEGVKSLESIISPNGPYYVTEMALDVMQTLCGKTKGATREDIKKYADKIREYREQLRILNLRPVEFYREGNYDGLLESLHNLSKLYLGNHQVLECRENQFG